MVSVVVTPASEFAMTCREVADVCREVAIALAERLPQIIEATDKVMASMTEGGVKLHPETVARFAEESAKRRRSFWPVWLALFIAALALLID